MISWLPKNVSYKKPENFPSNNTSILLKENMATYSYLSETYLYYIHLLIVVIWHHKFSLNFSNCSNPYYRMNKLFNSALINFPLWNQIFATISQNIIKNVSSFFSFLLTYFCAIYAVIYSSTLKASKHLNKKFWKQKIIFCSVCLLLIYVFLIL